MMMRFSTSSRVLAAVLASSLTVAGVASCAAFPAGPAAVAEADTASVTVSPRFDGFAVQSTDVAPFEPWHVTKLELALFTVVGSTETAVKTAAGADVVVTRTSGYTAPVTFNHLRYGNTYRIRATAYRTINSAYQPISTTDSSSYVDVVVTADTASLNQTHALKVKLIDRGLSAQFGGPEAALNAAPAQAGEPRTAPAIAHNEEDNQYLVVWEDARSSGDIYGQRLQANGTRIGSEFLIAEGIAAQDQPAVTYSAAQDCYFVVWRDNRVVGFTGIYGQKVTRTRVEGTSDLSGSNLPLGGGLLGACRNPAVAAGKSGTMPFVVAWKDGLTGAIDLQPLNAAGSPLGALSRYPDWDTIDSPALAQDPASGSFLLAYTEQDTSSQAVVGRFVASNVSNVGTRYAMGTSSASKSGVAVAASPQASTFLVAWREGSGSGATIRACLLKDGGTPAAGPITSVSVGAVSPGAPAVAFNRTTGEFLITWIAQQGGPFRVHAQRLSATGAPIGGNFALSFSGTFDTRPAVAYNPVSNQAFAVWQAAGANTADLAGRLLDYFARPLLAGEVTPP
ncbi:hypothetical protein D3C72_1062570 [compost metagenome]